MLLLVAKKDEVWFQKPFKLSSTIALLQMIIFISVVITKEILLKTQFRSKWIPAMFLIAVLALRVIHSCKKA